MQGTYNAVAGDVPMLLAALLAFVVLAIVGSYIAGRVADMLYKRAQHIAHDVRMRTALGERAIDYNTVESRVNRLCRVGDALDYASGRYLARAMYWRIYTIRARRMVRRRMAKLSSDETRE